MSAGTVERGGEERQQEGSSGGHQKDRGVGFLPTTAHVQPTSSCPGVLLMACGPASGDSWVRRVFDLSLLIWVWDSILSPNLWDSRQVCPP